MGVFTKLYLLRTIALKHDVADASIVVIHGRPMLRVGLHGICETRLPVTLIEYVDSMSKLLKALGY